MDRFLYRTLLRNTHYLDFDLSAISELRQALSGYPMKSEGSTECMQPLLQLLGMRQLSHGIINQAATALREVEGEWKRSP